MCPARRSYESPSITARLGAHIADYTSRVTHRDLTSNDQVCVVARPGDLTEGLFGGILLYLFEILPYLRDRGIYPTWSISSQLYGTGPDNIVTPGVLETTYPTPSERGREVPLLKIAAQFGHVLGSDWDGLSALLSSYFRIPERIEREADAAGDMSSTLGVHYRGNDKNTCSWDSNAVSVDDFTAVIDDWLSRHRSVNRLFVATDEPAFLDGAKDHFNHLEVISMGAGKFHKTLAGQVVGARAADAALTDCVILSRCTAVLNTSSALSAFAKVLNPTLDIHRCAASKLFNDIPYFPIAHIPIYETDDPDVRAILDRTLEGDWSFGPSAEDFAGTFLSRPRRPVRHAVRMAVEKLRLRKIPTPRQSKVSDE